MAVLMVWVIVQKGGNKSISLKTNKFRIETRNGRNRDSLQIVEYVSPVKRYNLNADVFYPRPGQMLFFLIYDELSRPSLVSD